MSKYADKQKAKEMIKNGNDLSALTLFLISEGDSYDEAKKGIEPTVSWWEESVAFIEKAKLSDIGAFEEYDHDLWPRTQQFPVKLLH